MLAAFFITLGFLCPGGEGGSCGWLRLLSQFCPSTSANRSWTRAAWRTLHLRAPQLWFTRVSIVSATVCGTQEQGYPCEVGASASTASPLPRNFLGAPGVGSKPHSSCAGSPSRSLPPPMLLFLLTCYLCFCFCCVEHNAHSNEDRTARPSEAA